MTAAGWAIELHRKIVELIDAQKRLALVLVLEADGSTPLKAGAQAIVEDSGRIFGTIGGGQVEAQAQQRAVEACKSGKPLVFDFQLHGTDSADEVPICGGAMRILIDPSVEKYRSVYEEIAEAIHQRERGVIITTICNSGDVQVTYQWFEHEVVPPQINFPGTDNILLCLKRETPKLFTKNGVEVFVEPVIPKLVLLIAGGGHIGQALALQANLVGFDVIVVDDRSEFTDPALYPEGIRTFCDDIPAKIVDLSKEPGSYIVIVTRGHKLDAEVLEACIHAPAAYIGMIGSRRKVKLMREDFIESGRATAEEFDKIFAPIGLDIGSVTVPEIAASITAQLIAVRRKGIACGAEMKMELS